MVHTTDITATHVGFDENMIHVHLNDGRRVACPLDWFPRLAEATPSQRENWRFIAGGQGIHWEDLDEDLSVEGFFKYNKSDKNNKIEKQYIQAIVELTNILRDKTEPNDLGTVI